MKNWKIVFNSDSNARDVEVKADSVRMEDGCYRFTDSQGITLFIADKNQVRTIEAINEHKSD